MESVIFSYKYWRIIEGHNDSNLHYCKCNIYSLLDDFNKRDNASLEDDNSADEHEYV